MQSVSDMQPMEERTIAALDADTETRKRLIDMGILPGRRLRFVRTAPLGDPLEVDINGCHVAIRKNEARMIRLENREDRK